MSGLSKSPSILEATLFPHLRVASFLFYLLVLFLLTSQDAPGMGCSENTKQTPYFGDPLFIGNKVLPIQLQQTQGDQRPL